MSSEKYKIGTMLRIKEDVDGDSSRFSGRIGTVVSCDELEHSKLYLPGDICVKWHPTRDCWYFVSTYDSWFLDENCEILEEIVPVKRKEVGGE